MLSPVCQLEDQSLMTSAVELYLIYHKVRGEPAFDIAHRLQIGSEEGWIIPTSGHRAYPTRVYAIHDLVDLRSFEPIPDDWPDHYTVSQRREPKAPKLSLGSLLGLIRRDGPPIKRRPVI